MSEKATQQYIPQYVPLYRKYRPKNLQEVVGQEHVKKALTNAINLGKISHAYLFTGPRGTGKTSIARILAKSLNCQQGPTITPCETCPSCVDIKNSTPMDVIEIDAASNRSVEDARNILEKIQYVPVNGKYKIYIIDEVHMLTNQAFNALLKTLEEPPENVIFILATTEPQKVLETITSRCQRFDFRRITTDDIIKHLKHIAKLEQIKIDDEALFTIAKNAAGGMRDSLALLDQVSVLDSAKTISAEDINKLLGRISFDMLHNLTDTIIQSKPQAAIELLSTIYNAGNEPSQILVNLLGYLKNLLIVKNCQGDGLLVDLTQLNNTQIKDLKVQSEHIDTHQIVFLIEKTVYYVKELKINTNQHLWLEVALIDLANLAQNTSLLELQERISRLESGSNAAGQLGSSAAKQTNIIKSQNSTYEATMPVASPKPVPVGVETPTYAASATVKPVEVPKQATEAQEEIKEPVKEVKTQRGKDAEQNEPYNSENSSTLLTRPDGAAPTGSLASPELSGSLCQPFNPSTNNNSQPATHNDLGALWLGLLQNISSTPTVSLLTQHTRPVEISEEKVVIGCKENFLKMVNSDSKRTVIEEAAKKFFNKPVSVLIQSASAEDFSAVEKKNPIIEKPIKKVTLPEVQTPEQSQDEEAPEVLSEDDEYIEHELAKTRAGKKDENFVPSDQVSMVIKLFDGKYID